MCIKCGLVHDSRTILLDVADVKVFSDNPNQTKRLGEKCRIDQEVLRTVLVGSSRGKGNDQSANSRVGEKKQADPRDWYKSYFDDLRSFFELKQKAVSMCMDKVSQMLTA